MYLFVYKSREVDGDQIYLASTSIDVDPANNWILDNGAPKDLFVLNWSDTYWQPVSQSIKNYSKTGPDRDVLDYKLYNTYSVQTEVDDMEFRGTGLDFTLGFETELEKLDTSNDYNITAEYLHTWNTSGSYYVDSFTFGPANFNLDGVGVSRWNAPIAITEQE